MGSNGNNFPWEEIMSQIASRNSGSPQHGGFPCQQPPSFPWPQPPSPPCCPCPPIAPPCPPIHPPCPVPPPCPAPPHDPPADKNHDNFGAKAYGYVYATPTGTPVAAGANVPFSGNGPLRKIAFETSNSTIVVPLVSGIYQINYSVNVLSVVGTGNALAIAVNNVVDPTTPIAISTNLGVTSGTVMLPLNAGDIVTLRNSSGTVTDSFTLAASGIVAQLNLLLIDKLLRVLPA